VDQIKKNMSNNLKIFNMPIRKALCITLVLLLSLSTYATAAVLSPGCDKGSCMKGAMRADGALMASKSTAMPFNCCSGMQGSACDIEKGQNFDIPDVILAPARLPSPDSPIFVAGAIDGVPGNLAHRGFGPNFHQRAQPLSAPIYLYNLALLC
jgi:hypothetical protein